MRYIVLMLMMFSTCLKADVVFDIEHTSIIELLVSPDKFNNRTIFVTGYLERKEETYFLCFSKEVCTLNGKEKLILSIKEQDNVTVAKMDKCLVKVRGNYKKVGGNTGRLNFLGNLFLKSISFPSKPAYKLCTQKTQDNQS